MDDPLRVLRCIRFASRLGFDIVPEVKDAARDRMVQASGRVSLFVDETLTSHVYNSKL
jgi:tRNA nucleotidyltransferase (CCA-adding enzyme)